MEKDLRSFFSFYSSLPDSQTDKLGKCKEFIMNTLVLERPEEDERCMLGYNSRNSFAVRESFAVSNTNLQVPNQMPTIPITQLRNYSDNSHIAIFG